MPPLTRSDWEQRERAELAPYAWKSRDSAGREHPEEEHPHRTAFQRDRDRVIHCSAFRRLEYKTQVFVNHEGDHYRTRLTHTIEVVNTALSIARPLRLSADLTEAIALAHDLGHTPFGHAGEAELDLLMAAHGGFEHNNQSLRIVSYLEERYPNFRGLNLTRETRGGLCKHALKYPVAVDEATSPIALASLEARVADLSDTIAYSCSDLEDGLSAGLLHPEQCAGVELWDRVQEDIARRFGAIDDDLRIHQTARLLKNLLVGDLIDESSRRLDAAGIENPQAAIAASEALLTFSAPIGAMLSSLRRFLWEHFYSHHRVVRMQQKARYLVRRLFEHYVAFPMTLPPKQQQMIELIGLERAIADYVAGMTDRFAGQEYQKLFDPFERV